MTRNRHLLYRLISFAMIALLPHLLYGQERAASHNIYLNSRTIPALGNAHQWLDSAAATTLREPALVLIQFSKLPTPDEKKLLAQNGIQLHDYVPDNTFAAIISPGVQAGASASVPVYSIVNVVPEWKAGTYLWKQVDGKQGNVEVLLSFYPGIDGNAVKEFVGRMGGQIMPGRMEKYGSYKVMMAAERVHIAAQWYGVRNISHVSTPVPLDIQSRAAIKGNISNAPTAMGGYGLLGDSVTVGVGDNSSGSFHVDIKDRIKNFNPAPLMRHGVHINGIVGGTGNVNPLAVGLTPHVTLVDHFFDFVLSATGDMYRDFNMTIANNSYTLVAGDCDYMGTYDVYSAYLDTLSLEYPYVQHVFASGNDGFRTCGPYPPGFGTISGGYQPSKNTLLVGSSTTYYFNATDESRGPMRDGRLKPEMVSIGVNVFSTLNSTEYLVAGGTSMAAPHVASGLAALTQRYKQLHGGTQPRADLLKAIMLNGCMDYGNPGPDYAYGFGIMDMYRSLQILENNHYLSNSISTGDSQTFTINVPANTAMMKVMLYWNDVPANPSSAKQLVNDLDITVRDPSGGIHKPLVLDHTPANVANIATEQEDHLNNVEQVTVMNPVAGTYTVRAQGYSIPSGPQPYVVVYDIVSAELKLTFPQGGEAVSDVDSFRVYWDMVDTTGTFTLLFSSDAGTNWITINDNIPGRIRRWGMLPSNINSGKCMVRLIKNGTATSVTSGRFAVNAQPVVEHDGAQCPGYINIHWASTPGAAYYQLWRKDGPYMQMVDTTSATAYSFSNMPLNDYSYVAVQPVIDGLPAYRSVAAEIMANSGDCSNPVSTGDLMVEKIVSPTNGRMFTGTALGTSTTMTVRLRSLYSAPCSNYQLMYKVNSGPWNTSPGLTVIPAAGTADVDIPSLALGAAGSYSITVAVHNLAITDPQPHNDTLSVTVLNLPNDPIDLSSAFLDDFETMGDVSVGHDSIGVSPNGHWDFFNDNDTGRMRSFVFDDITISGNRSISLDETLPVQTGSNNMFIGTFNLQNYDTATAEIRMDFDYILHGIPENTDNNLVFARGSDTGGWKGMYTYNFDDFPGALNHVLSLSLTDVLRAAHHNFSSSTGVAFGQKDVSLIGARNYGSGLTMDNFRIYTVANDAAMVKIVAPNANSCGLPASMPLTVQVRNGVGYTLYNVQLFYKIDGGSTFTGVIDSIRGKDTVNYTFAQLLNAPAGTTHNVSVWLTEAGDTYTLNDSILNYKFRNSRIITQFPYLENFENSDGGFYTAGTFPSWQYGTPASPKINKAASGAKAWKTNLNGYYNNLERSYLYSPCYDISALSNPMLSFSTAMDIENCGSTLCDAAYIEYTFDEETWIKLGAAGQGTNWYDSTLNIWNTKGFTRWHVASIPLPKPPVGQTIHLRFVMQADPSYTIEGIAVDDIHIYDLVNPIGVPSEGASVTEDMDGNSWQQFISAGNTIAAVQPRSHTLNGTATTLYVHDTLTNPGFTQYVLPRSFTMKAPQNDSVGIRLYVADDDFVKVLGDASCASCTPVTDVYRLGITQYSNTANPDAENGTLLDDSGGVFNFLPWNTLKWVPYDKGYYAEFIAKPSAEYWFNNGGPTANVPAGVDYLSFTAFRNGQFVSNYWYSLIDTAVDTYTVEWSLDGSDFATAKDTAAAHLDSARYLFDDPVNWSLFPVYYFRLKWSLTGRPDVYYSQKVRVDSADSAAARIRLDARMINHTTVQVDWTSDIDVMVDHYILDRSVGGGNFVTLSSRESISHFGQAYQVLDKPAEKIPAGKLLHYRLTAVLHDGSSIVLPERVVEWTDNGALANIYPNPAHNSFNIEWNADAGTQMQLHVTNAVGASIFKASAVAGQWHNTTLVQAPVISKGVYFIRLDIGGNRYTSKIVFE